MLEIVPGGYKEHILVFIQEIVQEDYIVHKFNYIYMFEINVYVLETDPYRGCKKHMHL